MLVHKPHFSTMGVHIFILKRMHLIACLQVIPINFQFLQLHVWLFKSTMTCLLLPNATSSKFPPWWVALQHLDLWTFSLNTSIILLLIKFWHFCTFFYFYPSLMYFLACSSNVKTSYLLVFLSYCYHYLIVCHKLNQFYKTSNYKC